jgi:hypothetical protein
MGCSAAVADEQGGMVGEEGSGKTVDTVPQGSVDEYDFADEALRIEDVIAEADLYAEAVC